MTEHRSEQKAMMHSTPQSAIAKGNDSFEGDINTVPSLLLLHDGQREREQRIVYTTGASAKKVSLNVRWFRTAARQP
jgi:hypothetical protein